MKYIESNKLSSAPCMDQYMSHTLDWAPCHDPYDWAPCMEQAMRKDRTVSSGHFDVHFMIISPLLRY